MLMVSLTFTDTPSVLPLALWQPLQLATVSLSAASNDFGFPCSTASRSLRRLPSMKACSSAPSLGSMYFETPVSRRISSISCAATA